MNSGPDDPPRAGFSIPDDDRQQAAYPEGDDFVVAAFAQVATVADALFGEWLRERDYLGPRR